MERNLQALLAQAGIVVSDTAERVLEHSEQGLQLHEGAMIRQLPCPIHPTALIAALQNPPLSAETPIGNGWVFDARLRQLTRGGDPVLLTEKEAELLSALLMALPHATPRETLLRRVWAYETEIETHTLETHIYRLRQKLEALEPTPCRIETVEGSYRLAF